MKIRDYLAVIPAERPLITYSGDDVTAAELMDVGQDIASSFAGSRVALQLQNPVEMMKALAVLDGVAEAILFLSPFVDPAIAARLATEAGCSAVISEMPDALRAEDPALPVYSALSVAPSKPGTAPTETTRWLMTTSGTTGEPKIVGHTLASLTRTTKIDLERAKEQRWGMIYDFTRFAGLQVFLQSVLSGARLIVPNYHDPLERKIALFAENGCTHLSGTPTLWRKILMMPDAGDLKLQQITLGGEIADGRVLTAAASAFPQARVVHIFASTEAGVGFSVSDRKPGFPASYLQTPPAGIEIKIDDGRLFVRNSHVSPRYLNSSLEFANKDGWVDTGDAVNIVDDRVLFLGRVSGTINVGGDKVHPEEVERAILSHPLIASVVVSGKSNPIVGQLVVADVVLNDPLANPKEARADLAAYLAKTLERHKVPALIRIVQDIKENAAGKIMRK